MIRIAAVCRPVAGVSSPCRGPSHFLLRAQEKVTKEKGTPMARPPGILPYGCAGGLRGFPTAHPCAGGKLARIPAGHPADFPPPTRRAIGAPGRAARSCAQKQEQQREHPTPALPCTQGREATGARSLALASASGAHDARLLFRGLWAAVRWGRSGRAAGESRDGLAFSRGQDARSKSPATPHALAGQEPGKRQPGWPSLLATFLLATHEKSSSRARRAHETALNDTTPESTP